MSKCNKCTKCQVNCLLKNERKNPFPYLTPSLCSHACKYKCPFNNDFRDQELKNSVNKFEKLTTYPEEIKSVLVYVVGCGITGLTIIHQLLKAGYSPVLINDTTDFGGLITTCIPAERIKNLDLFKEHILKIKRQCNFFSMTNSFQPILLKEDEAFNKESITIYCRGNSNERKLYKNSITGCKFLKDNYNQKVNLPRGARIAVIGLGNTACDVINKLDDYEINVYYRKKISDSHANKEELDKILVKENVHIFEETIPLENELNDYYLIIEATGFENKYYNQLYKQFDYYAMDDENTYYGGNEYFGSTDIATCIKSGIDISDAIIKRLKVNKSYEI